MLSDTANITNVILVILGYSVYYFFVQELFYLSLELCTDSDLYEFLYTHLRSDSASNMIYLCISVSSSTDVRIQRNGGRMSGLHSS